MEDFISRINKEINEYQNKITFLQKLLKIKEKLPDLEYQRSRWNHEYYYSSLINSTTTDCDINHSCGCCPDAVIQVYPYVIMDDIKVYADGIPFNVGESNELGIGEKQFSEWENKLKNANIPEVVIEKVRLFFEENPPINCNDDPYDEHY